MEIPDWRQGVDLAEIELALNYLGPLLDAIAATGSSMLVRVDGERADPGRFTVAISSQPGGMAIRFDDADLGRAVAKAIVAFDRIQG